MEHHRQVHVVSHGVYPVSGPDAATVSVTGIYEHTEFRPSKLDALGYGKRAAMNAVKAVCVHVMRQSARTSDARHEYRFFREKFFVAAQSLDGGEDRIIAAAGAPSRNPFLIIFDLVLLVVHPEQAFAGAYLLGRCLHVSASMITRLTVFGLSAAPRHSLQQSMSNRYRDLSSIASAE